MRNILDTVADLTSTKAAKISLVKSRKTLALEASSSKGSTNFVSVKVSLSKIPTLSAGNLEGPVCIDLNVDKLRATRTGFVPKLIILSGAETLRKLKKANKLYCEAWVGERVLNKIDIMADDAIGSNALTDKLRKLVTANYTKPSTNNSPGCYAYIVEVYPFENYLIFSTKDEKYRQAYKLDPVAQEVALDGKPIRVIEKYVDAPTASSITAAMAESAIEDVLRDGRNFAAPALGGFNGPSNPTACVETNYGAPGSELNNPMLKLMLNVEDALAMYQTEAATGIHKVIYSPYAPIPPGLINAGREARIAAESAGINLEIFSAYDFLKWQDKKMRIKASNRVKMINGMPLEASAFAYVGLSDDISTWHLPINTTKNAEASLTACAAIAFVPKRYKAEARAVIVEKLAAAGGPHLGKGKSASIHLKEIETKKKKKPTVTAESLIAQIQEELSAGGPGSGPHKVLEGFGFKKGNSISQSKTNYLHIYHGKGPGGTPQQVLVGKSPRVGGVDHVAGETFTHISNPGTPNAIVHAKQQPIAGLGEHMVGHWVDHIGNMKP